MVAHNEEKKKTPPSNPPTAAFQDKKNGEGPIFNPSGQAIIEFKNVFKSFGNFHVFKDFSLKIEQGQINFVIGRSGSGKSVMLKHILGFLKPDAGQILIYGQDSSQFNSRTWLEMRKKFGILFQDSALFDSMNVFENVAFPIREHTHFKQPEIDEIVREKLFIVGLAKHETKMPSELSGGMKKRVALARAIALNPDLVMFDEPTSGLDPIISTVVDDLIKETQKRLHSTFLVISHDMRATFRVADRISMLYNGKTIFSGNSKELQNAKDPLVQQFIHGATEGPFEIFY